MDPLSLRPSIPLTSGTLHHVGDLLTAIENLSGKPTGMLQLRPSGQIFLEEGKICWAVVPGQQGRLRQLLRYQRNPPIEQGLLDEIVRSCRDSALPLAHALLASGEITEEGLRQALLSHSSESIARIANSDWSIGSFTAGSSQGKTSSFCFSTVELMAHLGAGKNLALSAVAKRELSLAFSGQILQGRRTGVAFLRQSYVNHPVLIAVHGETDTTVTQMRELCSWTSSMFDLARAVDSGVTAVSGSWRGSQAVVTWLHDGVNYTCLFGSRAGAAVTLSRLVERGLGSSSVEAEKCVS